ncbi:MAG: hypothetical protein ACKOYN_02560 [Planctomycetota bacterium]
MKPASKFSAYDRHAFLAAQPAAKRELAGRLCDLLEAAFAAKDIAIYAGFPIVVRDMEWIAGFAMRATGPVAYCCSPATLAEMGAELKPYMSGKSCVAVKPRKGESIETVLALIGRAFRLASHHGGMISKRDAKVRERGRNAGLKAAKGAPAATKARAAPAKLKASSAKPKTLSAKPKTPSAKSKTFSAKPKTPSAKPKSTTAKSRS